MQKRKQYVGIHRDIHGGMTPIGKMIRDAWVFGLLPEEETCEGWTCSMINQLMDKVNNEWDKYGCMVSQLPKPLFNRHQDIHSKAIRTARSHGWEGEHELTGEV
ncbi:MAG: hypothetical protein D6698_04615 [Gammaproteobacteria bacterium]|nr:MAG: hypothetical protein D6698_04615 [Gammaproteobacteria bacterium]